MEKRPDRNKVSSHPLYALLGSTRFPTGRARMLEAICRHAVEHEGMKHFSQFGDAMHATRVIKSMEEKRKAENDAHTLLAELFRSLTKSGKAKLRRSINGEIDEMDIYDVEKKSAKRRFTVLFDHVVSKF